MSEKESALRSGVADQQGSNRIDNVNLLRNLEDVKPSLEKKSKEELDRQYLINTFTRFKLQRFAQNKLLEREAVCLNSNYSKCHRATLGSVVSLMRNPESSRAYYNGVVTCANALLCPVCSPRIMGMRGGEIGRAVKQWLAEDRRNTCYMLTFTFAHLLSDGLSGLLEAFKAALVRFWERGDLKRLLGASGRVGRITATEIQCSQKNGWHPHQHVLLFCRVTGFDQVKLAGYWLNALKASGLSGLSDIAFDIVEARSCETYLTKISSEMALGNLKQGRVSGHFSPMQLIDEMMNGSDWAADRFCELFKAARGLHSLCWSRGLKARFGIGEVSDEAITEGVAQPELQKFMDVVAEGFRKLSTAEKALFRNYAAMNDYERASNLLSKLGIEFYKDVMEVFG
ncbi:MAG: protein rep [Lentisphaeria bacterium]|nr:protein rep [Lentisphaeria bacterium]MBS1452728.1 protein rep [Lentisphaeria bacterium]